jgi:hypothetical protein
VNIKKALRGYRKLEHRRKFIFFTLLFSLAKKMSLFERPATENNFVEFSAGKCIRDGNTIRPDLRKG